MQNHQPHQDQVRINQRVKGLIDRHLRPLDVTVYRLVNPNFSRPVDVTNGKGGLVASGRWNLGGSFPVTYTSLDVSTALQEALAHTTYFQLPVYKALPKVLVALHLKVSKAVDLRNGSLRQALSLSTSTIRNTDWNAENQKGMTAITQAWGEAFCHAGVEALIAPSAAVSDGVNVIIFPENLLATSSFNLLTPVNWS